MAHSPVVVPLFQQIQQKSCSPCCRAPDQLHIAHPWETSWTRELPSERGSITVWNIRHAGRQGIHARVNSANHCRVRFVIVVIVVIVLRIPPNSPTGRFFGPAFLVQMGKRGDAQATIMDPIKSLRRDRRGSVANPIGIYLTAVSLLSTPYGVRSTWVHFC